jgi:hypothetical protein
LNFTVTGSQRQPVPRNDGGELDTALAFLSFARKLPDQVTLAGAGLCRPVHAEFLTRQAVHARSRHNHEVGTIGVRAVVCLWSVAWHCLAGKTYGRAIDFG